MLNLMTNSKYAHICTRLKEGGISYLYIKKTFYFYMVLTFKELLLRLWIKTVYIDFFKSYLKNTSNEMNTELEKAS